MTTSTQVMARRVALLMLVLGIGGVVVGIGGMFIAADAAALFRLIAALGFVYVFVSLALLAILARRERTEHPAVVAPTTNTATPRPSIPPPAQPVFLDLDGTNGQGDDLTRIDGVWASMATALQKAGIRTYVQLAEQTPEALEQIIKAAGIRMVGSAATWSQQARLLAAGDEAGLQALLAKIADERDQPATSAGSS